MKRTAEEHPADEHAGMKPEPKSQSQSTVARGTPGHPGPPGMKPGSPTGFLSRSTLTSLRVFIEVDPDLSGGQPGLHQPPPGFLTRFAPTLDNRVFNEEFPDLSQGVYRG